MSSPAKKRLRLLLSVLSVLALIVLLGVGWFYWKMRQSLPQLDGSRPLAGLAGEVTIARDAQGIPFVRGTARNDVARALGFLHAQDRFFQMDLLRRRGAGELAALFGKAALPLDRSTRLHGFRRLAGEVVARLAPADRALLDNYTAGVNAGLTALAEKPFEYLVLRTDPLPWKAEDSILVIYAMTLDLQDSTGSYELSLTALRDQTGVGGVAFFAPLMLPDDAALDGTTAPLPPIPSPNVLDLRSSPTAALGSIRRTGTLAIADDRDPDLRPGSNNFALAGAHTANGAALVANDPHLDLGVPNIWYRASLEWSTPGACRVTGVTLPGLPTVVIGSNGHIAWGLTDAYADTGDLISLEVNSIDHRLYKIPGNDDLLQIEQRRETIEVKGGAPETIEVPWTRWGPIVATGSDGHPLVYHWLGDDATSVDFGFMNLVTAQDVPSALAIAHHAGMPAHNFVVGDTSGRIAWTIVGHLPKRFGYDGRLPTSWSYGDRHWDGVVPPEAVPTVLSPESGRIWTANNRVMGGAALATIGDGGFDSPPRAAQIRDRLEKLEHATPADLRAIQLDDRALFLGPWQQRLLAVLTPDVSNQKKSRAELRKLAEHWEGHASVDSVSYRIVRAFRSHVADLVFVPIFAGCAEEVPGFDWHKFHYEAPLQALLREKPAHLLNPKYRSWDDLLVAAADATIDDFDRQGIPLAHATWGRRNSARILHPFGRILPGWIAGWLNMPADELPGDSNMPRVQTPSFGASMRMVVSPGHEDEGLLHIAGGQSGHPLSPYYRTGYEAWAKGEATPLLPGPAVHMLTLKP